MDLNLHEQFTVFWMSRLPWAEAMNAKEIYRLAVYRLAVYRLAVYRLAVKIPAFLITSVFQSCLHVAILTKCGSLDNVGVRLAESFISVRCPSNLSFTQITLKTLESH